MKKKEKEEKEIIEQKNEVQNKGSGKRSRDEKCC